MGFETARFIEELQTRPEIYNPKHPQYHTHRKEKMKELGAIFGLTAAEVQTKYNSLRTQYTKWKKELEKNTRSGAGAGYKVGWKYFDMMGFMQGHVEVNRQIDSIATPATSATTTPVRTPVPTPTHSVEQLGDDVEVEDSNAPNLSDNSTPTSSQPDQIGKHNRPTSANSKKRKAPSSEDTMLPILERACSQLDSLATKAPRPKADHNELFGAYIAESMRQLTDPREKAKCKLEIQGVIFRYRFPDPDQPIQPPRRSMLAELTSAASPSYSSSAGTSYAGSHSAYDYNSSMDMDSYPQSQIY